LSIGEGRVIDPAKVRDGVTGRLVDAVKRTDWRSIVRPRTVAYFLAWGIIGLAMLTVLSLRTPLSLNVLHDRNPVYVELRDGSVRNGYDIKVLNMTPAPRTVELRLEGLPGAEISLADDGSQTMQTVPLELAPDRVLPLRLYVRMAPDVRPPTQRRFRIVVTTEDGRVTTSTEATFEVPEK
jgi:polyferredoxin